MTTRNDTGPQGYCGFEVGQHVVCMNGYLDPERLARLERKLGTKFNAPVEGIVYTIRKVMLNWKGLPVVYLKEIVNPPIRYKQGVLETPFATSRFRPLPKLRVEDFLAASTPKDAVSA